MTAPATRRDALLQAAADLFAERGYHGVGIDDIGAAAGISGPGVYRHFPGKQALLAALCTSAMDRMLTGARAASEEPASAALASLVRRHARFAVQERALIGVWAREQRALDGEVRRSLRRASREYEQLWQDVVTALRPALPPEEAAVLVSATLSMLNGSALAAPASSLDPVRRSELLAAVAHAALAA